MINVNIEPINLQRILKRGFILENQNNILTIRNQEAKPIMEIIYLEETNEILVNTEKEFIWCSRVHDIEYYNESKIRVIYEYINTRNIHCGNIIAEG